MTWSPIAERWPSRIQESPPDCIGPNLRNYPFGKSNNLHSSHTIWKTSIMMGKHLFVIGKLTIYFYGHVWKQIVALGVYNNYPFHFGLHFIVRSLLMQFMSCIFVVSLFSYNWHLMVNDGIYTWWYITLCFVALFLSGLDFSEMNSTRVVNDQSCVGFFSMSFLWWSHLYSVLVGGIQYMYTPWLGTGERKSPNDWRLTKIFATN